MQWEVILFVAAALAVLAGCLLPNAWLPPLPNDKLMHFAAFGGLTALAARLLPAPGAFVLALLALALGGWLIECLQQLVPGRHFCWRDQAANVAGIGAVGGLTLLARALA